MHTTIESQEPVRVWDKISVLALLDRSDKAVVSAIKGLFARQTADEQVNKNAIIHNARGFNKLDSPFLSDIATKLPRYNNHMTPRQTVAARKMLRKYWKQLLQMIEEKGGLVTYKIAKAVPEPVSEAAIAPLSEMSTSAEWTV